MHTRAVLLVHSVTRNAIRKTTLIGTQEQNTGSTVSSVEWNARTKRTWGAIFWRTTTTDSPPTSQLAFRLPAQSVERRTETGSPWSATFVGLTTSLNLSPGEDEQRPRGVPKAMASGTRGTRASISTSRPPQTSSTSRSSPTSSSRRTPTSRNSRVSITRVQEEEVQIEGEAIEGEKLIRVSRKLLKGIWFSRKKK